jgi:hypothetical protein
MSCEPAVTSNVDAWLVLGIINSMATTAGENVLIAVFMMTYL